MNQYWQKKNSSKLLLFFNGWGNDELPLKHIVSEDKDVLILSDYTNAEAFQLSIAESYEEVYVIAWSMGVMVANEILRKQNINICRSVAVNGSVNSVHNEIGIPEKIYLLTLNTLSEKSVHMFQRNMCVQKNAYQFYMENKPARSFESQKAELGYLYKFSEKCSVDNFIFTHAIIGTKDKIFPVDNLRKMWSDIFVKEMDAPHYLFAEIRTFEELLND